MSKTPSPIVQQLLAHLNVDTTTALWGQVPGEPALEYTNRLIASALSNIEAAVERLGHDLARLDGARANALSELERGIRPDGMNWIGHYAQEVAKSTTRISQEAEKVVQLAEIRTTLLPKPAAEPDAA